MAQLNCKLFQASFIFWIMLVSCFCTSQLSAQLKLDPDEEVKVNYLGSWRDGLVIEKGKSGQYLVEYFFANSPSRKVFHRSQLRKLYEFRGSDYGRNWQSDDGNFKLEAAILRYKDDEIILLKPDFTEVTVPLERLSSRDQSYVRKFKKNFERAVAAGQIPAPQPRLPEIEEFSDQSFGATDQSSGISSKMVPFGALPEYMREFTQKGVGFQLLRPRQDLVSAIAVGGPEQLILVNGREDNFFNKGALFQSQLYWLAMKDQKVLDTVAISNEDYALDYDPRNRLLLTYNKKDNSFKDDEDPTNLTLWSLEIKGTEPKPIVRWRIGDDGHSFRGLQFGKIINDKLVLTKGKNSEYIGWDIENKRVAYRIAGESFFSAPVRLTGDRRFLIVPEDGKLTVFETATGKVAMSTTVNARHVSGANINSDGTRLAAVSEKNIFVWNLESESSEPEVYPAPLVGSPFKSSIDWIGEDRVLVASHNSRILYSLKLGIPLWTYKTKNPFFNDQPLVNYVIDGVLFYTDQDFFNSRNVAVGAVTLPGPSVDEVTANIDLKSLNAVQPGSRVGMTLDGVSNAGEVEAWLREKIEANQWVYDPASEIVLEASMGVGATQTVEYQQMGGGGRTMSASFRPHFSNLKIKRGDQILWQTGTSTGAPSMIRMSNNSQVQSTVNRYQQPNVQFFKSVVIDDTIIDPKYSRGFGVSELGLRGIVVVSTTPPGRADDPEAAAKQFEEDRKQAQEDRRKTGSESEGNGESQPGTTGQQPSLGSGRNGSGGAPRGPGG